MSVLAEYVAVLLLENARGRTDEQYGGSVKTIRRALLSNIGVDFEDADIAVALDILEPFAGASKEFSPLTDGYWSVNYDNFRYYFIEDKPDESDDEHGYNQIREMTKEFPILAAYARSGGPYVADAKLALQDANSEQLDKLRKRAFDEVGSQVIAPASDRVVSLDHNQQREIETAISEVSAGLSSENSIDGDTSLRERFLAELSAGRELIRAQSVRVYLLYETLVKLLAALIEKYKDKLLAEAAKKLLDLLIQHLFGK